MDCMGVGVTQFLTDSWNGFYRTTLSPLKFAHLEKKTIGPEIREERKLAGGFKYFLFSSLLGEDSHFD